MFCLWQRFSLKWSQLCDTRLAMVEQRRRTLPRRKRIRGGRSWQREEGQCTWWEQTSSPGETNGRREEREKYQKLRGGIIKKLFFFFGENPKGGRGGLAESKISVNRKNSEFFGFFCQKGGGLTQSKISVSRKMRFLGIFCQKEGIFSEKNQNFLELGGGSPPIQNFC